MSRLTALQSARLAVLGGGCVLLAITLLFLLRRCFSGGGEPLGGEVPLLTGGAVIATATLLRLPWSGSASAARAARGAGLFLPLPSLVLFALSLSLAGAPAWSIVVLWFGVAAHEGLWGVAAWRRIFRRRPAPAPPRAASVVEPPQAVATPLTPIVELDAPPGQVTQQMVRTREGDSEIIAGMVRAELAAGERTCSLHVAFCPPLAAAPTLQCEQTDGPPATISLGEVQSYGARFDVRLLKTAAQPATIAVEFYAHT